MKLRCQGAKTPGHFTGFDCVLDDGHDGFCEPYVAPSVDEWRATAGRASELVGDALRFRRLAGEWQVDCDAAHDREDRMKAENARLQAELDALRAILASGCDACAHAAPPAGRDLDDCTPPAEIAKAAASLAMAKVRLARADSSTQRIQWSEEVGIWSKRLSELRAAHGRDLDAETVAGVQVARDDLRGLAGKVET